MSTWLQPLKRYYGRLHLGRPLGLNLRYHFEHFDYALSQLLAFLQPFYFQGQRYAYFHHPYNQTSYNERCLEIPLITRLIKSLPATDILEVGNVLKHYGSYQHSVVDKYEVFPGVTNLDIINYQPKTNFRLIVSISTFEHIGWDERPRQRHRLLPVINHLQSLLAPHGQIVFTAPIGYNQDLDSALKHNQLPLAQESYFERLDAANHWQICSKDRALKHRYHHPYPFANAVVIGWINAST